MNTLSQQARIAVISLIVEGTSMRSIARLTNVDRTTIGTLTYRMGLGCFRIHDDLVKGLDIPMLELDEMWGAMRVKQRNLEPNHSPDCGDQYNYAALCRASKLIVSFMTAKRNGDNTLIFIKDLRERVKGKPTIITDGFESYHTAIAEVFGSDVNYAQLVKHTSGSRFLGTTKRVCIGTVEDRMISTSFIERSNLTVRMGLKRFTRRTNALSKKYTRMQAAVALFYTHYNFCRIHQTLKTTPAVAAGVVADEWSTEKLITEALARETIARTQAIEEPETSDEQPRFDVRPDSP